MHDPDDAAGRAASTDSSTWVAAVPPRTRGRASAAAARRRRPRRVVIVLALVVSVATGCGVGSLRGQRGLAVGAGVEVSTELSATDDVRAPNREVAVDVDRGKVDAGVVTEVRPTDLVEMARDRGVAPPPPGPDDFVTPSGNILCAYAGGQLDCHVGSGLAPPPTHRCPTGTDDWSGIRLGHRGPSVPWCTNVRLEDRVRPPLELAYGRRWSRDGIECISQPDGLRCQNEDGGEFLVSRTATRHGRRPTGPDHLRVRNDRWRTARPTPGDRTARRPPSLEAS